MRLMRRVQAIKRAPVHTLGLATIAIQNACLPAQALADRVRPSASPVRRLRALCAVRQIVAMPARIHAATYRTATRRLQPRGGHELNLENIEQGQQVM